MPRLNRTENPFVQCPYYKYERDAVIYCEGAEEGNCLHMAFSAKKQRKAYEKQFCEDHWPKCMVADALNRKWEYVM